MKVPAINSCQQRLVWGCAMALNKFAHCTANNFRTRLCKIYSFKGFSVRSQSSHVSDETANPSDAKKQMPKVKPSRVEMTRLNNMRSRIIALHDLSDSTGQCEFKTESVEKSGDALVDYLEAGMKEPPKNENLELKSEEDNFIKSLMQKNDPGVLKVDYGTIRKDNIATFEKRREKIKKEVDARQSQSNKKKTFMISKPQDSVPNRRLVYPEPSPANLFDQQYFSLSNNEPKDDVAIDSEQNFIEEQFFPSDKDLNPDKSFEKFTSAFIQGEHSLNVTLDLTLNNSKKMVEENGDLNFFTNTGTNVEKQFSEIHFDNEVDDCYFMQIPAQELGEVESLEDDNTTKIENFTRREIRSIKSKKVNIEDPKTAYEAVVKMRLENSGANIREKSLDPLAGRWDGKKDSKGFKVLTSQTQNLQEVIDLDLVTMLCNSVLFENEEIIAINKPYGLPSHGGPGILKSVASLVEKMAARKEKNVKTYHVVHRLDKDTTGVMLLAKTERTAQTLTQMFLKKQVVKVYWALTKGVPDPPEGIIDIPIGEEFVDGKYRMNLVPKYSSDMRLLKNSIRGKTSTEAVTHYKILDSNDHSALIECRPESGIKHQIRCHLAFGLNTPVLGDHKYSHVSKISPQKLSPDILRRLGIRQAKVRHLGMHLHARSLVLPEYLADGRNLFVAANLPPHFAQNMKWLKLSPKR